MSLADLITHRTRLLLKESAGNATESDLNQLAELSDLISRTESSITSKENNSSLKQDEKIITDMKGNAIKPKPDEPDDQKDLDLDVRKDLDLTEM